MDSSGLGGGFLSSSNGGILDLDSPVFRRQLNHQQQHQQHNNNNNNNNNNNKAVPIGSESVSLFGGKGKGIAIALLDSEEDEPSYNSGENCGVKGKKSNPWQRMKWTGEVVKLLIAVVACVGDDGAIGDSREEPLLLPVPMPMPPMKRKSGALQQKKGKWKTVSKIMIGKGCHVSPQQCEDKFNDLNKRYKRLNDILGRGTSCRVVENPVLMESMPHLSAKSKEDVRKILSSKHLFYKEMCAYHNGQRISDCHNIDENIDLLRGTNENMNMNINNNNNNDNNTSEDDEEKEKEEDEEEEGEELENHESPGEEGQYCNSPEESFEGELTGFFEDPTKSAWERREWVNKRSAQLEEQRVQIQAEALELEKQRFRWLRYCGKKDRELERLRLENERMRLENERNVLHLRHKELQFDDRVQPREHIDLSLTRPQ